MKTVGAFEAKARLSELLAEVERDGGPVLIQRRGRSVAVLEAYAAYDGAQREDEAARAVKVFAGIRARVQPAASGEDGIASLVAEGRKR